MLLRERKNVHILDWGRSPLANSINRWYPSKREAALGTLDGRLSAMPKEGATRRCLAIDKNTVSYITASYQLSDVGYIVGTGTGQMLDLAQCNGDWETKLTGRGMRVLGSRWSCYLRSNWPALRPQAGSSHFEQLAPWQRNRLRARDDLRYPTYSDICDATVPIDVLTASITGTECFILYSLELITRRI